VILYGTGGNIALNIVASSPPYSGDSSIVLL